MRVVSVELAERSYCIRIGRGLLRRLGQECRGLSLGKRCAIITDDNVAALYARAAEQRLRVAGFEPIRITVPAGEPAKSLAVVQRCYDQLAAQRLERKSFVVALGGGLWAWLYARSGSLFSPWLSHTLVDLGIMAIGYDLGSRFL